VRSSLTKCLLTWCLALNVRLGIGIRKAHTSKYVLLKIITMTLFMCKMDDKKTVRKSYVCRSWEFDINKHTHKDRHYVYIETHRCKLEFKVIKARNKRLIVIDASWMGTEIKYHHHTYIRIRELLIKLISIWPFWRRDKITYYYYYYYYYCTCHWWINSLIIIKFNKEVWQFSIWNISEFWQSSINK
jgi:hypothetical protein